MFITVYCCTTVSQFYFFAFGAAVFLQIYYVQTCKTGTRTSATTNQMNTKSFGPIPGFAHIESWRICWQRVGFIKRQGLYLSNAGLVQLTTAYLMIFIIASVNIISGKHSWKSFQELALNYDCIMSLFLKGYFFFFLSFFFNFRNMHHGKLLCLKIMIAIWIACRNLPQSILIVFRLTAELNSRAGKDSNHFRIISWL